MRAILLWFCLLAVANAAGVVPLAQPVRHSLSPGDYVLLTDDGLFRRDATLFELSFFGGGLRLKEKNTMTPVEMDGIHTPAGVDFRYDAFCECCGSMEFYGTLKANDRLEGKYYVTDDQAEPGHFRLLRLPDRTEP